MKTILLQAIEVAIWLASELNTTEDGPGTVVELLKKARKEASKDTI